MKSDGVISLAGRKQTAFGSGFSLKNRSPGSIFLCFLFLWGAAPTSMAKSGASAPSAGSGDTAVATGAASLEERLVKIEEELAELERSRTKESQERRISQLEGKIAILVKELEKLRRGAEPEAAEKFMGARGLGPAASKVYRIKRGASLSGYGEMVYQNYSANREDGSASGKPDRLDFLRAILYAGFKFNDRITFNSEIEFEHATTGKGGEVSVEFAYLDFVLTDYLGVRAGMVLIPMGFVNELHEPPIFRGVLRTETERAILPSTWRENGLGVFGEAGPFAYRFYLVNSFDATGFSASGVRGGRQSGSKALAENFALTGRIDYVGKLGLVAGGSFFTGKTGQGRLSSSGSEIGGRTTILDLHGKLEMRGFQLRGIVAFSSIEDAAEINELNGLAGMDSVGSRSLGGFFEAGYDVMTLASAGRWSVIPFVRYERVNTQDQVPDGFLADPKNDRTIWTFGVDAKPIPNIVFKVDYQIRTRGDESGINQINAGLGYLF